MTLELPGVLSAAALKQTAQSIAAVQNANGSIPWFPGGHIDTWDHVQGAMALAVSGELDKAQAAYKWLADTQRPDGSWAIRYDGDYLSDAGSASNFTAYIATGIWHYWLITSDIEFVGRMWPHVKKALDFVLDMRLPSGVIAWARDKDNAIYPEALLSGNASIALSLRCGAALGELLGELQSGWLKSAEEINKAINRNEELFVTKPRHAMDWYYPIFGASYAAAEERIDKRWDEFVTESMGIRCVNDHEWVTGAETCELAIALDIIGRRDLAIELIASMQHLRTVEGAYWTGLVLTDMKNWPVEQTTWTAATVILAVDALTQTSKANGIFRADSLPKLGAR